MSFFAEHRLSLRCSDMEMRQKLVSDMHDLFRMKNNGKSSHQFEMQIDEVPYSATVNVDDRRAVLVVFLSADDPEFAPEDDRSTVVVRITEEPEATCNGSVAVFGVNALDKSNLRSIIAYASMMCDCAPFGLHLRAPLSALAKDCLKRVFRSLDVDFDGRIGLKDLSEYNCRVFGSHMSSDDLLAVFRLLNEGDPLYIETIRTYSIDYEQFEALMQQMVNKGYGHTVFKLMEAGDYRKYMFSQFPIVFDGETKREMGEDAVKFLTRLFQEFMDTPTHGQVMDMFKLQGGPPIRMSNTKVFTPREWIRVWSEWCIIEPSEAARHLVAFGFPLEKIGDAFGVEEVKRSDFPSSVAVLGALTSIIGGVFMFMRRRK